MKSIRSYFTRIIGALLISFTLQVRCAQAPTFLVFGGKSGWIGQKIVKLLEEQGHKVAVAQSRLENRQDVEKEIETVQPKYVINAAGLTGRPNIDWCEDNQPATIRANIIGALTLVDVCFLRGIHVTNFGTGCIYEYDKDHALNSGIGFKEEDTPNFTGSFYSKTKVMLDELFKSYNNVLNLRLRMPISDDLHGRSFITKIVHYDKVIDVPNSMSVLSDLLPIAIKMTVKELKGNYNFVNPGAISHSEILDLYKIFIDPSFTYKIFTVAEQDTILKARRSNNELDVSKLLKEFPEIPPIKDSIKEMFKRMKNSKTTLDELLKNDYHIIGT